MELPTDFLSLGRGSVNMEQRQYFFLDLYTKTHIWASTRLEKRGGLARTRNGPKARFKCKSIYSRPPY